MVIQPAFWFNDLPGPGTSPSLQNMLASVPPYVAAGQALPAWWYIRRLCQACQSPPPLDHPLHEGGAVGLLTAHAPRVQHAGSCNWLTVCWKGEGQGPHVQ